MARLAINTIRFRPSPASLAFAASLVVSVLVSRYLATGGFFFLSRSSDLTWLRAANVVSGELPPDKLPLVNLFVYTVMYVKGFVKDAFVAIELSSFLFHLALVIAGCFITAGLVGSWKAGVLVGVLLALHPSMVALLQASAYSVLAGLACLSLALLVSTASYLGENWVVLALAGLSVLTAFSEPYAGVVLFLALILEVATRLKWSSRRVFAVPLASLPGVLVSCVLLFLYGSSFTLPGVELELTTLALTYLAAALGALLLYARRDLKGLRLPLSWLVASFAASLFLDAPFRTLAGALAIPPLLMLTSALLLNVGGAVTRVVEEAEGVLEVDVAKLFSAALVVALVLSSLLGGYGVYAGVNSAHGLEWERYGDVELRNALSWIGANTPEEAVVVAEYPLGDWVEAIAGRAVVSNRPVDSRSDMEGFQRSYAADSILNAKYEIRNAFLRLRDWGPVAPQRAPFFAVSDGESFINFLYVDESHAQVKYVIDGESFTPNFYDYYVYFSGWVERSPDSAALRHVFEVEGAVINKTIRLSKGALEASVEYLVEAKPGAILQDFSLKAWVPWERRLGYTGVSGSTVELSLEVGDFQVNFEGNLRSLSFGPDREWAQQRAEAHFEPVENRIYAKMTVKVLSKVTPVVWSGDDVVAYATEELMAQYHVAYAVVPTIVKKQMMDLFGLDFPTFVSMFENSKLTVYKVVISG